ncbi:MAG: YihA family ribosome biogenesis GTP-binding protein, partial [Nitrospirae bacterium]|nr:YihA family ribosome biogenesis GTP-binding protein [Nitrospirota bacterium]
LIVLLDIRREPGPLDQQLFSWLDSYKVPFTVVLTKADQVPRGGQTSALRKIKSELPVFAAGQEVLLFSSKTGQGREALLMEILKTIES